MTVIVQNILLKLHKIVAEFHKVIKLAIEVI